MTLHTLQIGMEWFTELPGGLNRLYAHLIDELAKQNVDTRGLVTGTPDVARQSHGLVHAFAETKAPLLSRLRAVRAAAQDWLATHRGNVVVASHFALNAMPVIGVLRDRPFVVHFHGPWGHESQVEGASRLSVLAKEFVERRVYQRANASIVLSQSFRDMLIERFGVERESVHVVPGGVDVARFARVPSRGECRAALGWPTDRPIVLSVRRLVRRVGVDVLVEAAVEIRRRVPDVLILIAGSGPLHEELSGRIRALGLEDTVRLLGFLPDEQLPLAYRGADLTVVPTVALEGFGLITIESLAAGTPCIVTPVGGLPEIVAPLAPQLVAASSRADDIADAIAGAVLGQRPMPSSETCSAYARDRYDWPVIAARVKSVYESTLA